MAVIYDPEKKVYRNETGQTFTSHDEAAASLNANYVAGRTTPTDDVITSSSLSNTPSIDFKTPTFTPTFPVDSLDSTFQLTQPEQQAQDLTSQIQGINSLLSGEAGFRAEQEQQVGISQLEQTQQDLANQLKLLQAEYKAIVPQTEAEFRGRASIGAISGEAGARQREIAVRALTVSALFDAASGNLASAQAKVDRAVAQKYDPIRAEIQAKKDNLDLILNSPAYSIADKKRAARQKQIQDAEEREINKQEAEEKEIAATVNTAIKYGLTDTSLMQRASQAKTAVEAKQLLAQYLQDPKAQLEIQSLKLENALTQAKINQVKRQTELMGEKTKEERKAQAEAIKNSQTRVPALEDKIVLINGILGNPAINTVVGPSRFARQGFLVGIPGVAGLGRTPGAIIDTASGRSQNLIGSVSQLVSKEFLDAVLSLKSQGGTLGQITEREGRKLQEAATKIGTWEMRDKDGTVTGYNVAEKDFKAELEKIKSATQAILNQARNDLFSSDERDVLDALGEVEVINPGLNYYNQ